MNSGIKDSEVYINEASPLPIEKIRAKNDKPVSLWIDEDGVSIMPFYIEAGRREHIYKS